MNQDLNRRKDDRHPTQPLQWEDKPDLLAMRAGVNEIQREVERARAAGLTMLALPIETANAACCYVAHLGERLAESVTAAPAEQASKQVPTSINTLEFNGLLGTWLGLRDYYQSEEQPEVKSAWNALIAHIDAKLARQPAAPVAATEQAADRTKLRELVEAYRAAPLQFKTGERMPTDLAFEAIIKHIAPRPTDDHLWDETLRDRDTYHKWADKLAEAIAKHFNAYIGEHSNTNCPWSEALDVIENAAPLATPADAPAQQQKATLSNVWASGGVHWDLFPGYLIDYCEGNIISEEGLQFALADMLKDADYLRVVSERATPADAGAGEATKAQLTDDEITEVVRRAIVAGEIIWTGFKKDASGQYTIPDLSPADFKLARAIEREVLARLSTSAAPVTAEPVATSGAEMDDVVHILREYASNPGYSHGDYADTMSQAANVIELLRAQFFHYSLPQPAVQVPSIDRDSVLEEAAKACEAWGMAKVRAWADDEEMSDDAKARAWDASVCASTIRALKGQPAAAHAAKTDEWISVDDERKPEERQPILLFVRTLTRGEDEFGRPYETEGELVEMGEYRFNNGAPYFQCFISPMSDNDWITHWMPLPAAPIAAAHAAKADEWPTHADLLAEDLEKIAESWTGCMYDSIGGMIDIGADLRNQFAKLKLAPQDAAAHAAHDQKGCE